MLFFSIYVLFFYLSFYLASLLYLHSMEIYILWNIRNCFFNIILIFMLNIFFMYYNMIK